MTDIRRLIDASSLGTPSARRLRRRGALLNLRRSVGHDTLPESVRQAREAVEDCFIAMNPPDYDEDTCAAICQALDEATGSLTHALMLATEEDP